MRLAASLPYRAFEKEGWEYARCDLLKVSGLGKTKKAALKNLKDSVTLLLQGACEDSVLEKVLHDCGLKKTTRAGVTVWEAPPKLASRFSGQQEIGFNATLRATRALPPNTKIPPGEIQPIESFVISATSSHASGISA